MPLYVTEGPKEGKRFKHFINFNRLTETTPPGLMFLASSQILFLPFQVATAIHRASAIVSTALPEGTHKQETHKLHEIPLL